MDCVTILAQAVETSSPQAAEEAVIPMETFWSYITSLNLVEAVTFISFGVVCLFYGWRVFKILVVISFALLGLFLGIAVTDKINQPRLPSILGIMAVAQKEIKSWNAADASADVSYVGLSGSPTQFLEMSEFHAGRQGEILQGSPEEVVTLAIDRLVELEIV